MLGRLVWPRRRLPSKLQPSCEKLNRGKIRVAGLRGFLRSLLHDLKRSWCVHQLQGADLYGGSIEIECGDGTRRARAGLECFDVLYGPVVDSKLRVK